jgi:hypothetical protein
MSETRGSHKKDCRIKNPTGNGEERPVNVTETFVPFDGTMDEFTDTPAFQQMVKRHSFVLVKPGATHCSSSRQGRYNTEKCCKKGVIVSTLD